MPDRCVKRDPHQILGVPKDATVSQIRDAYRSLARRYNPLAEVNQGLSPVRWRLAERIYIRLGEAYAALTTDAVDVLLQDRREPNNWAALEIKPRGRRSGGTHL